jgi:hypothetical protein
MLAARIFSKAILGFVLLGVSLTLGACETPPSQNVYPPLRYSHLPPLKFAVAAVEIEVAYVPSTAPPNVEVLFPVRPSEAAVNWAEDRLVATGSQRRLRYVVKEASVTETPLEVQGGITGAVTTEQSADPG